MKAADACEVLVDPANLIGFPTVTIPEGLRLTEIVSTLAEEHRLPRGRLQQGARVREDRPPRLRRGQRRGLPLPGDLRDQAGHEAGRDPQDDGRALAAGGRRGRPGGRRPPSSGTRPAELMIIASLVEAEGRGDDMPKIARVIYNRLDGPGDKGGTNGTLGIDAAIAYGLGLSPGSTELTPDQLAEDTPYNTRLNAGLPPTPDRGARRRRDRGGGQPGGRRLVLLRHRRPLDRRDQVLRGLRRLPRGSRRVQGLLRDLGPLLRCRAGRVSGAALRRAGRPRRALAVAGAAPGGVRRARSGLVLRRAPGAGGRPGGLPRRARRRSGAGCR